MTNVTITHPEGAPMRFSKKLIEFLANCEGDKSGFLLGCWLSSMPDDDLEQLRYLAKQCADGVEEVYLDDIVLVCIRAISAERRTEIIDYSPPEIEQWIYALCIAATLDSWRRRGLAKLGAVLSIEPESQSQIFLTDRGYALGQSLTRELH